MTNKYINITSGDPLDINNENSIRKKINDLTYENKQIEEADFFYKTLLISKSFDFALKNANVIPNQTEIEISNHRRNDDICFKASVILTNKTPRESKTNLLAYELSKQLTNSLQPIINPNYGYLSTKAEEGITDEEYFTIKPTNDDYKDAFLKMFLNEELYTTYLAMNLESNLSNKEHDASSKKKMKL